MQTGVPTQMRVLVTTPNIAHAATPPVFGDDATSFAQRRAAAPIIRQIEVHDRDRGSGRISLAAQRLIVQGAPGCSVSEF